MSSVYSHVPDGSIDRLPIWRAVRQLLLTGDGKVRARVTAANGFPAPSSARDADEKERRKVFKERMAAALEAVSGLPVFAADLAALDVLPPVRYEQDDWNMLQALKRLLPGAVAELEVVFRETSSVDYTEVAHRALARDLPGVGAAFDLHRRLPGRDRTGLR